jgi:hypothetical protein
MAKETAGEDISAQLETAIAGEVETPTTKTETIETPTQQTVTEDSKTIPYSRFKEVIDQKNDLTSQVDELQSNYQVANDSLAKMTQMLEAAKGDQDLIKQIQALANDPKMLPHVDAIDKKLRGIEEEIEETGEVSDKTLESTRKVLEQQQTQLQNQVEQQYSDILTQRADAIADKWLESLPEQYTDQDREIIGQLWASKVNWNDVESNPDGLDDVLANTFQETINSFGLPRGGLIDPNDPDSYEIELPETPELTPEQEIAEIVGTRNYSAYKTEDGAEVSDADFAADLGKVLKIGNR